MVRFAALAGYPQDADNFRKESELVKEAFNSKYLHTELGYYSNNTVTANILSCGSAWFLRLIRKSCSGI